MKRLLLPIRPLLLAVLLASVSVVVLMTRLAWPHHRLLAMVLYLMSWLPLVLSWRGHRRRLRAGRRLVRRKIRPFVPHIAVALILCVAAYVGHTLAPVDELALVRMSPGALRGDLDEDLASVEQLRLWLKALLDDEQTEEALQSKPTELSVHELKRLRHAWREGVMGFIGFDFIKEKYKGFHHLDFIETPGLHADAFFTAFSAYVYQYNASLRMAELVGDNEFMKVLLNEAQAGVPANTYFRMQQRLTHPDVLLRFNSGAAYFQLVRDHITAPESAIETFERERGEVFLRLGRNPDLFVKNPLEVIENAMFTAWFPLQRSVAIQMSHLRTSDRDYFITPERLAPLVDRLAPGDILLERRNWHLTNIGIPGFWPHALLYIGSLEKIDRHFGSDQGPPPSMVIKDRFPDVHRQLLDAPGDMVIEAIRPGVVIQPLAESARCDYLAAIRPRTAKSDMFAALLCAFEHVGKGYDFNFDFSTDGTLVCSELVYKAYAGVGALDWQPDIVNGRVLLAPNRMAEYYADHAEAENPPLEFVLFLDACEKEQTVSEADELAFRESWSRPKWDVLQE